MLIKSTRPMIRARIKSGAVNLPLNVVKPFHNTQTSRDAGPIGFTVPVIKEGIK